MKLQSRATASSHSLNADEILHYHENGVIGPYTLCEPEEMAACRSRIEEEVLATQPPFKPLGATSNNPRHYRHLDCRVVYDLCAHRAIVDRLASLFGPNLLLWRTSILLKETGADEGLRFPWHQDGTYFRLVPEANISFWLAIDEATEENGCVQLIPGTHTSILPEVSSGEDDFLGKQSDIKGIDTSNPIKMILRPGQFFIFSNRTLHFSQANLSGKRRMSLVGRVVPTIVRVDRPFEKEEGVLLLCGKDEMGFNRVVDPPAFD